MIRLSTSYFVTCSHLIGHLISPRRVELLAKQIWQKVCPHTNILGTLSLFESIYCAYFFSFLDLLDFPLFYDCISSKASDYSCVTLQKVSKHIEHRVMSSRDSIPFCCGLIFSFCCFYLVFLPKRSYWSCRLPIMFI